MSIPYSCPKINAVIETVDRLVQVISDGGYDLNAVKHDFFSILENMREIREINNALREDGDILYNRYNDLLDIMER